MAAVTSEILANALRSSLNNLKSFAELLNAELTEEGQGITLQHKIESRSKHKEDVSRILNTYGESEAFFQKGSQSLRKVEQEVNRNFEGDGHEVVENDAVTKEIKEIIKIVDGKDKPTEVEEPLVDHVDENKIAQMLENVKDILNEFHPLKFLEDEDENDGEEDDLCRKLEHMQKKAMRKLEKDLQDNVDESNEPVASTLATEEEFSESSDEDPIDYGSLERVQNEPGQKDDNARKNLDVKLKQMWEEYQKRVADNTSIDTKQLFDQITASEQDIDFNNLSFYPKYSNSILELFSGEAIVVLGGNKNYVDPITKKDIQVPLRNKICNHIYEKDTIYSMLEKKYQMACPCLGCSCRSFTIHDLEEDEDVADEISQNLARKQAQSSSLQQNTEDMETDNEDDGNDTQNIESDDESLAESQELF